MSCQPTDDPEFAFVAGACLSAMHINVRGDDSMSVVIPSSDPTLLKYLSGVFSSRGVTEHSRRIRWDKRWRKGSLRYEGQDAVAVLKALHPYSRHIDTVLLIKKVVEPEDAFLDPFVAKLKLPWD